MPRKRCCGRVEEAPACRQFLSTGPDPSDFVQLGLEEAESIRLKDLQGLDQAACAREMGLSRPTFQRVLASARRKLATALAESRSIRIEGGHYEMKNRVFECLDCGRTWEEPPCTAGGRHGYEIACPACGSMKKTKIVDGVRHACGGHAHGHDHEHAHGHEHGEHGNGHAHGAPAHGGCGCGS